MKGYVIVSAQGSHYSTTGTPAGIVVFPTQGAALAVVRKIRDEMPSKCLPLRVTSKMPDGTR